MKGIVGLLLGKENLLDHLGIFCHLYKIPLKVFDPSLIPIAKAWYPDIAIEYSDLAPYELDPSIYPWILTSTLSSIDPLRNSQLQIFGKCSSFAYLPHGISAKSKTLREIPMVDLFLFPGKALEELLGECDLPRFYSSSLYTGDFRSLYYNLYKDLYEMLMLPFTPSSDKPPLILMPSCSSQKYPSFFFDLTLPLLNELQKKYSLLIKPHPLLEEERPGFFWQLKEMCNESQIPFLDRVPPTLPLISRNSLLVSDVSSTVFDAFIKGSKIALLRKDPIKSPYDLSDMAIWIDSLEDLLNEDFKVDSFESKLREEKLKWLYSPLLKRKELNSVLKICEKAAL